MVRREIREKAFMFLFQLELQQGDEKEQYDYFVEEQMLDTKALAYFNDLVEGVTNNKHELDACFITYLKGWRKERLPRVDLVIMRIAVYEILFAPQTPDNVAIAEAVLLTKKFSSEKSRSYINAVLGKVSKNKEEYFKKEEVQAVPEVLEPQISQEE